MWAETDQALNTCIVDAGIYLQKTCFMIITNQTKLFNGLLNSNLCQWYIRRKSPNLGEKGLSLTKETVHEIPISSKILSHNHCQETISDLVSKIILFKEQGKDTTALEKQIDNLVYKLYELTYEELKVIDPAFPLSKEAYERIKLE